jgi:hypothetical protein
MLGIRWTIGDVSAAGFEALRLSVHGAMRLFGADAAYLVCVNTIPLEEARRRTGPCPPGLQWRSIPNVKPAILERFVDEGMAEGVAWKLLPLRAFPDAYELALDNDVILWDLPEALRLWLQPEEPAPVVAADVTMAHGRFAELCGNEPRNSGIRGIGPGFDYEAALAAVLRRVPVSLSSELDEQGLQIAALSLDRPPLVVTTEEVSICSPFCPHTPGLGRCGAHFVGLNAKAIPWKYYDRPGLDVRLEHWAGHRPELYRRVGLPPPGDASEPSFSAELAG